MLYLALLRGINVGGKNKIPMADLRACLERLGFQGVRTYIASGNAMFEAGGAAEEVAGRIEGALTEEFEIDSDLIRALVLSHEDLRAVVTQAPEGFGQQPDTYHSDVAFLLGMSPAEVMGQLDFHPEVDKGWRGPDVVYYQRLSAKRTKSRFSKIVAKPVYQHMTIRSWSTTTKLLALLDSRT